ncbi:MAG: hypothetical protein Q9219_007513 [cf. Caloplaca sp. 3 TL-2023]
MPSPLLPNRSFLLHLLRPRFPPPRPLPKSSLSSSRARFYSLHSLRTRYHRLFPPLIRRPLTLLTWLPVLWFIQHHIFQLMSVTGPSMYPFLNTDYNTTVDKDVVAVKMWRAGERVRRGDVVVFRSPIHPETLAVKRVIALEGDTVITRPPYPIAEQEISLGHVWVEGEHPENTRRSYDSNYYGAVRLSLIIRSILVGEEGEKGEGR